MSLKFTTLDEVRTFLDNISNINRGGCAIAALAIKRWLKKFQSIDVEIVYASYEGDTYHIKNTSAIKNNNPSEISSCYHSGVKINDKIIDSNETWKEDRFPVIIEIPETFVIASLKKDDIWNYMFDRKHVNKIQKTLDIDLSDVDVTKYNSTYRN